MAAVASSSRLTLNVCDQALQALQQARVQSVIEMQTKPIGVESQVKDFWTRVLNRAVHMLPAWLEVPLPEPTPRHTLSRLTTRMIQSEPPAPDRAEFINIMKRLYLVDMYTSQTWQAIDTEHEIIPIRTDIPSDTLDLELWRRVEGVHVFTRRRPGGTPLRVFAIPFWMGDIPEHCLKNQSVGAQLILDYVRQLCQFYQFPVPSPIMNCSWWPLVNMFEYIRRTEPNEAKWTDWDQRLYELEPNPIIDPLNRLVRYVNPHDPMQRRACPWGSFTTYFTWMNEVLPACATDPASADVHCADAESSPCLLTPRQQTLRRLRSEAETLFGREPPWPRVCTVPFSLEEPDIINIWFDRSPVLHFISIWNEAVHCISAPRTHQALKRLLDKCITPVLTFNMTLAERLAEIWTCLQDEMMYRYCTTASNFLAALVLHGQCNCMGGAMLLCFLARGMLNNETEAQRIQLRYAPGHVWIEVLGTQTPEGKVIEPGMYLETTRVAQHVIPATERIGLTPSSHEEFTGDGRILIDIICRELFDMLRFRPFDQVLTRMRAAARAFDRPPRAAAAPAQRAGGGSGAGHGRPPSAADYLAFCVHMVKLMGITGIAPLHPSLEPVLQFAAQLAQDNQVFQEIRNFPIEALLRYLTELNTAEPQNFPRSWTHWYTARLLWVSSPTLHRGGNTWRNENAPATPPIRFVNLVLPNDECPWLPIDGPPHSWVNLHDWRWRHPALAIMCLMSLFPFPVSDTPENINARRDAANLAFRHWLRTVEYVRLMQQNVGQHPDEPTEARVAMRLFATWRVIAVEYPDWPVPALAFAVYALHTFTPPPDYDRADWQTFLRTDQQAGLAHYPVGYDLRLDATFGIALWFELNGARKQWVIPLRQRAFRNDGGDNTVCVVHPALWAILSICRASLQRLALHRTSLPCRAQRGRHPQGGLLWAHEAWNIDQHHPLPPARAALYLHPHHAGLDPVVQWVCTLAHCAPSTPWPYDALPPILITPLVPLNQGELADQARRVLDNLQNFNQDHPEGRPLFSSWSGLADRGLLRLEPLTLFRHLNITALALVAGRHAWGDSHNFQQPTDRFERDWVESVKFDHPPTLLPGENPDVTWGPLRDLVDCISLTFKAFWQLWCGWFSPSAAGPAVAPADAASSADMDQFGPPDDLRYAWKRAVFHTPNIMAFEPLVGAFVASLVRVELRAQYQQSQRFALDVFDFDSRTITPIARQTWPISWLLALGDVVREVSSTPPPGQNKRKAEGEAEAACAADEAQAQ